VQSEFHVPQIALSPDTPRPIMACTAAELARLRAALAGSGEGHAFLTGFIQRVDAAMAAPLVFPPRGKAHNQWYQCDDCQLGLETVDETHHRCPRCGRVYSGPPYDDVIFGRITGRNLGHARDAGWAFQLTGDTAYARFAAEVLEGYAARYLDYPYHDNQNRVGDEAGVSSGRLTEQTLSEASTMVGSIAPAYDLIHDAGVLSPGQHRAIREQLFAPMLENMDKNKRGKGNWQSWHNAGMLCGGAAIGDAGWVEKAIHQEGHGFLYQMQHSVSGDGFWHENSWGYHFYTMKAMVGICEAARRLGVDLWSHPALRSMALLPAHYTMPDGTLPCFNDSRPMRADGDRLEAAYAAYGDPVVLSLLSPEVSLASLMYGRDPKRTAARIPLASRLFEHTGHAILRTAGSGRLAAVLDFAPHGGGHGHYDALSLQLYGYGQALGLDRGMARSQAYRLPIHRDWYKTTVSHNTVLVNQSQRDEGNCRLESYADGGDWAAAAARDEGAYPGVLHRRMLALTPGYLLVVDDLRAESPCQFDWVYHTPGTGAASDSAGSDMASAAFRGGEYLEGIRSGQTDSAVRVRFPGERVTTHLLAAACPDTGVLTADGPGETVMERIPLAMLSRRAAATRFAVVIEPVPAGDEPKVHDVSMEAADRVISVAVDGDAGTDRFAWDGDGAIVVNLANGGGPVTP